MARESFDEIDGPVLSAGAADGNREIAAIRADEFGNPLFEKVCKVVVHALDRSVLLEILDHQGIASGELCETGFPVGIWQAADVEYEIRIVGYAVPIGKRFEQDRHAPFDATTDALADELAQLVNARACGVDDQIGGIGDRLEKRTLLAQGVGESEAVAAEGMASPRLRIAFEQRVFVGAQEDQLATHAAALEFLDQLGHRLDFLGAIARVDTDGRVPIGRFVRAHGMRDEHRQQPRRDVVDAVKIEVLEHVQRHALTGPG